DAALDEPHLVLERSPGDGLDAHAADTARGVDGVELGAHGELVERADRDDERRGRDAARALEAREALARRCDVLGGRDRMARRSFEKGAEPAPPDEHGLLPPAQPARRDGGLRTLR